jgi:hypothetical protein
MYNALRAYNITITILLFKRLPSHICVMIDFIIYPLTFWHWALWVRSELMRISSKSKSSFPPYHYMYNDTLHAYCPCILKGWEGVSLTLNLLKWLKFTRVVLIPIGILCHKPQHGPVTRWLQNVIWIVGNSPNPNNTCVLDERKEIMFPPHAATARGVKWGQNPMFANRNRNYSKNGSVVKQYSSAVV